LEVLLLPVGEELYAVPMDSFREVIAAPRVSKLPTAPEEILGLVNVRGEIMPIFDIARLLGSGSTTATPYAAVVEVDDGRAALAVTAAPQSASLGEQVADATQPMARGIHRQGDRLATLLDIATALAAVRR
jgi:chemotaxis signal transduction protein